MSSEGPEVIAKIRQKYRDNPPEGYTQEGIKRMGDEYLLEMDYFLNEETFDMDF